jgi:hypothetical protein
MPPTSFRSRIGIARFFRSERRVPQCAFLPLQPRVVEPAPAIYLSGTPECP